jgi:hypothetical protein
MESHGALLQQPVGADEPTLESGRRLDAVVVPTIRPWSVSSAVALAGDIGCALVMLCSTAEQAEQANRECKALDGGVLVTYVTPAVDDAHLGFLAAGPPERDIEPSSHVDIARKRNVGLLLARLSGWATIMFLDDDITGMTATTVSQAVALTASFQAVGFKIDNYPDNSVVCHAHRLAGGIQDVFPGGSALVVDTASCDSPFPPIYNEDWLFLFDALQRRSVALAGTLYQREYQPFAHARRAASEEFGDVIAEGLYRLLHEGRSTPDATYDYWRDVLERRRRLIDHVAERLLTHRSNVASASALMSLAAARKRLGGITEFACLSFSHAWRADVGAWREKLTGLPVLGDLAAAAKHLDLPVLDRGAGS